MKSAVYFLVISLSVVFACFAHGATRYVEKWGDDANAAENCRKSTPCLSIGTALGLSGKNDRIIVGPGSYSENGLEITQPGLKLESTAGRHATTLQSTDGEHALRVLAEKVQIGRKGKGFTFMGGILGGRAGLFINVDGEFPRLRVEGNRFGLPRGANAPTNSGYQNYYGVYVANGGGKIQVRHNLFVNNEQDGFHCFNDCTRALMQDNRAVGNGNTGISLAEGDRAVVKENLATANKLRGMSLLIDSLYSGLKVTANIANRNDEIGIYIDVDEGGILIDGNIVKDNNANSGIRALTQFGTKTSVARKNLVIGNLTGFNGWHVENMRVENNVAIGNVLEGFNIFSTDQIGTFKNNAAINSGTCGLRAHDSAVTADRFYLQNNAVPLCDVGTGSGSITGPISTKPPALGVKKASRVVGG